MNENTLASLGGRFGHGVASSECTRPRGAATSDGQAATGACEFFASDTSVVPTWRTPRTGALRRGIARSKHAKRRFQDALEPHAG